MANSLERLRDSPTGRIVRGREGFDTFLPADLPRQVPLSAGLIYLLDEASRAAAMLAGLGETIPNPRLLINPFLRKEAVSSSRIEGTLSSISDVLRYEAFEERDPVRTADVREVVNYVWALEEGLQMLPQLPLSMRLLNSVHARLMAGVRGGDKQPGSIRSKQVWIAAPGSPIEDAHFVPPPAENLPDLLQNFESFLNEDLEMPPLVQCALMHYQFECIHPYEDGNGRIGRLLIVLFLCAKGVLPTPLLYLSAYFERNRPQYYDHLFEISASGEWEPWLRFFFLGVAQAAKDALTRSRRLRSLQDNYRDRLQKSRQSGNTLRLLDETFVSPIMTSPQAAKLLRVTPVGARMILDRLVAVGILEVDRSHWPHFYTATEILAAVE
ncbi:MAG TPA: Fic family protein [Dehalococcoidia bacterium]|nr:Fic family protein [Dehalococcoidia bacterium]